MTPEELMDNHKRVAELRRRVLSGEPCTSDEIREVLDSVRRERRSAAPGEKPTRAKKSAANVPIDTDALMNGLMGAAGKNV